MKNSFDNLRSKSTVEAIAVSNMASLTIAEACIIWFYHSELYLDH